MIGARIEAPKAPTGVRCEEGVSPSPPGEGVSASPPGEGTGEGAVPPPQKIFLILALNMVSFGAFWMVFFTVQLPV